MAETKTKTCARCSTEYPLSMYYKTKSPFFLDGVLPFCPSCCMDLIDAADLKQVDKLCQWADWAFYPDIWMKMYTGSGKTTLQDYYAKIIRSSTSIPYNQNADWTSLNQQWRDLISKGEGKTLLPEEIEREETSLREFWEPDGDRQYTLIELRYMDKLFHDLERTQNISTGAQIDQAKKLARLSLDMDRAQKDQKLDLYVRLMNAYKELIKTAEFTPKNSTSVNSFETTGELFLFLEKTGFINKFYDGEERDIVDKTIRNQQQFLRRIVSGDSTLSERIEQRLERLKLLDHLEDGLTAEEEWSYDLTADSDTWLDNTTFDAYLDEEEPFIEDLEDL